MEERSEHRPSGAAPKAAFQHTSTGSSILKKDLPWLIPLGIAVCALTVFLMTMGPAGGNAAQVLSLLVSVAGVVVAIVIYRLEHSHPTNRARTSAQRRRLWPVVAAALGTIAVSVVATVVVVTAV